MPPSCHLELPLKTDQGKILCLEAASATQRQWDSRIAERILVSVKTVHFFMFSCLQLFNLPGANLVILHKHAAFDRCGNKRCR